MGQNEQRRRFKPRDLFKISVNKDRSFTLIELLIASSISIAILLTLYLSFNAGIFGYKRIQDALNTSAAAIKALSRLNLDLRNSFPYSASEARFEGNTEGIGFFTLAKTFRQNVTTQDYAHVFYGLEGDRLLRTCRRNQDSLSNTTEIGAQILAADLQRVLFSYGEFNSDKEILEWKDTWNQSSALPMAVRVVLTIKGKSGQKETDGDNFQRTIFLPLASINE